MKISRENYEIWFIDWLDNNLTSSQIVELNSFLDHNADLRDEFNDLCVANLRPATDLFKGKENLHRSAREIPEKQFEILCAASAEKDLDEEQQKELDEMISRDRGKGRILEIYRRLRLVAPEAGFHNKKNLLRITAAQKVIRIAWIGLSAAAVVAIVFMTGVFNQQDDIENMESIAQNNTIQAPSPEINNRGDNNQKAIEKRSSSGQKTIQPASENKPESNAGQDQIIEKVGSPEKVTFNIYPVVSALLS